MYEIIEENYFYEAKKVRVKQLALKGIARNSQALKTALDRLQDIITTSEYQTEGKQPRN